MRLRQIEVFHAVYATGSVSKAAELLHVSQPSISKVLRHTEDVLGFLLFERSGGKLIPTREAENLFQAATQVQQQVDSLNDRVRQISRDKVDSLSIAMTPGIGLSVGPDAMAQFHKEVPEIALEAQTLHYKDTIEGILNGNIDIGLVYEPYPHAGISRVSLATAEFVCLTSVDHPLGKKESINYSDLMQEKIINLSSSDPLGKLLQACLEKNKLQSDHNITANTYHIAKALAAKSVGVAVVDELTANSHITNDTQLYRFKEPLTFSVTAVLTDKNLRSRSESRFLEITKEVINQIMSRQPL